MADYLQRSRTAPLTLQKSMAVRPVAPRSMSQDHLASKPRKPVHVDANGGARIWAERRKPRAGDDQEDPLNRGPGSYWSGPSEEEWDWMKEHAPAEQAEDQLSEESVEDAIRSEDKFGVLSVGEQAHDPPKTFDSPSV